MEAQGWEMLCNCCCFINKVPYPSLPVQGKAGAAHRQAADGALSPAMQQQHLPSFLIPAQ